MAFGALLLVHICSVLIHSPASSFSESIPSARQANVKVEIEQLKAAIASTHLSSTNAIAESKRLLRLQSAQRSETL